MTSASHSEGLDVTEAHVYDVQGTLIDVSSVRHLVEGAKPDFDAFHVATSSCPAHWDVVNETRQSRAAQKVVVVMTGMNEKFRPLVVAWLCRYGVPFDLLLMRPDRDFRKDFIVKREMLQEVRLRGFTVTHAWDDNPQIVDMWRHENVPVTVVPGWTATR